MQRGPGARHRPWLGRIAKALYTLRLIGEPLLQADQDAGQPARGLPTHRRNLPAAGPYSSAYYQDAFGEPKAAAAVVPKGLAARARTSLAPSPARAPIPSMCSAGTPSQLPRSARGVLRAPLREAGAGRGSGSRSVAGAPRRELYLPDGKVTGCDQVSRTQILQAAVRVTERHGITALTLEAGRPRRPTSIARPACTTSRTRDELLMGIRAVPDQDVGGPAARGAGQAAGAYVDGAGARGGLRAGDNAHGPASTAELASHVAPAASPLGAGAGVERPGWRAVSPHGGARPGAAGPVPRAAGC